jgi:hypothetical protein
MNNILAMNLNYFYLVKKEEASNFRIEWSRGDMRKFSSKVIVNDDLLTIRYFGKEDDGVYVCKLYAQSGLLVAKTELDIKLDTMEDYRIPAEKPRINIHVQNEYSLAYNNRVKVDCEKSISIDSGPYSIEWSRIGKDMSKRAHVIQNSLIIERFSYDDLGEYSCVASNNAGRTRKTIKFFDHFNQIKYVIDASENATLIRTTTPVAIEVEELDSRLKFIQGSFDLNIGDTLTMACFDLCKLY